MAKSATEARMSEKGYLRKYDWTAPIWVDS